MRHFLILMLIVSTSAAQAQTVVINPPRGPVTVGAQNQQIVMTITLASPLKAGSSGAELTAGLNTANQSLYAVVNHECELLAPVLQGTCRLVQISTNGNINERQQFGAQAGAPMTSVSANATFQIEPKPTASPTSP